MTGDELADLLDEMVRHPAHDVARELDRRFPEQPAFVRQVQIWVRSRRDSDVDAVRIAVSARYDLEEPIADGGTATVYRARDRRLDRDVAIKVVHERGTLAVERVLAEACAVAGLSGEHVVPVLDVNVADIPYLVMELVAEREPATGILVQGASAARCRPRSLHEAITWIRDVASGIRHAHATGVIHGDLKPDNVLITPVTRRARVTDFGWSALHGGQRPRVTGTPQYLAPERARGCFADDAVDSGLIAVDVWGIGAIAYELVTGRAPWQHTDLLSAWEIAATASRPPPLDDVPVRIRRIIERALSIDPGRRYVSASAIVRDLDAVLENRPTSFDRSAARRAALWLRRRPALAATSALAIVFAAWTGIATSRTGAPRASRPGTTEAAIVAAGTAIVLELHTVRPRNARPRANDPTHPSRAKAVHPVGRPTRPRPRH